MKWVRIRHTRREWRPLLVCAAAAFASGRAGAHHSAAAFDQTKEVVVEGTITSVAWQNPHVYFTVQTGADGSAFEVHAGSASALIGMGVPRAALEVGRHVSVRAFPPRRATARVVLGYELTTEKGELLTLEYVGRSRAAGPPPATVRAADLAGRWLPQRAGLAPQLASMRQHLSAAGRAALADVESYRASAARCEAPAAPQVMLLPMVHDIAIKDGAVRIAVDWMAAERVIHLNQAEHPTGVAPSIQGHSIGHWEQGTLVIDTKAFTPSRSGLGTGVSSSADKHVVERLALAEDGLHLRYEITMEDPQYLAGPVSFSQLWDHRPDLEPSREACDPEVARHFLDIE